MEFKSLSATALESAIECPARFQATHIDYAADEKNDAAGVGSAVHQALEVYVRNAIMDKTEDPTAKYLAWCYRQEYPKVFGSLDMASETYMDGVTMLGRWHARTSFDDCTPLLLETKEEFPVPVAPGIEIPFRYVFDRLDQLEEDVFRVVDYKTIRERLTHDKLKRKLQARAYALAAQIRHPNARRIFVEFDLLRHERVGIVFTKDENADTWRLIKAKAKELWATTEPEERLNLNCRWCVRAAGCATLRSNVGAGGIHSLDPPEMADLRYRLESQEKGIKSLLEDLDLQLLNYMEHEEIEQVEGERAVAEVGVAYRRTVTDPTAVAEILGPELAARYGNFRLGDIDKILAEEPLTPEQRKAVNSYIRKLPGEPRIKTRRA